MKKIIVFGASGTAGMGVINECLKIGHAVTAFTRKNTFSISNKNLSVITGNSGNLEDVTKAISGFDVIVSALGNRDYQDPTLVSHPNVLAITQAIKDNQRLILVSAISMLQFDENSIYKYHQDQKMAAYVRYPLIDHFANYELLMQDKNTNWLMVCPPMIKEGAPDTNYNISETYIPKNSETFITGGNIGHFIANEIDHKNFNKTRIGLGTKK